MKKIQRQVMDALLNGCEDCGSDVRPIGNGGYKAPRCTADDCRWFLTTERAVELVRESDDYNLK